jgi:hypothetical protein
VLLFFSVARSQENGHWERAAEAAPVEKPASKAGKTSANAGFGMNMPLISSAFDTAMWLNAA